MNWSLILIPFVASAIGWATNKLAIWMLFNPKTPVKLFGCVWQGIFVKRQAEIAKKIGDLVADNLLTKEMLAEKVFTPGNLHMVKEKFHVKLHTFLENEFKSQYPVASIFVGNKQKDKIENLLVRQIDLAFKDLENAFPAYLENELDIRNLVKLRIISLDPQEINSLMLAVLEKELRFIEIIGAILGFLIGIFQVLLALYL